MQERFYLPLEGTTSKGFILEGYDISLNEITNHQLWLSPKKEGRELKMSIRGGGGWEVDE